MTDSTIRPVQLAGLDTKVPHWSSTPEYTTLGIDTLQLGSGPSLFARFLPDGSLLVANGPTIMRLGPEGVFEDVVARSGDGPGEFRAILSFGMGDDGSLFASDHLSGRLTLLEPDGDVIRTVPRLRPMTPDAEVVPVAVLRDGRRSPCRCSGRRHARHRPTPRARSCVIRS